MKSKKPPLHKAFAGFLALIVSSFLLVAGRLEGAQTNVYVSNSFVLTPTVSVIDGTTNTLLTTITLGTDNALGLAFTPDGSRLYVGAGSSGIVVIDTVPSSPTYNQVITTIPINQTVGGVPLTRADTIFIDPLGRLAYFHSGFYIGVLDIRPSSPTFQQIIGAVSGITVGNILEAAFTPDGRSLWWPEDGGFGCRSGVAVIDTDPLSPGFNIATEFSLPSTPFCPGFGFNPQGISITPDGTKAYLSGWGFNEIKVIDTATHTTITDIFGGDGGAPRGNAITADGTRLYVVTDGSTVLRAYNISTNSFVNDVILDFTSDGVHLVRLSVDGTRAYVSGSNVPFIRVVDVSASPPSLVTNVTVGPVPMLLAVQPLSPAQLVSGLISSVQALVNAGTLSAGEGQALRAALNAAADSLARGAIQTAINQLHAFINKVQALISSGRLTQAQGQSFIDQANRIIALLA